MNRTTAYDMWTVHGRVDATMEVNLGTTCIGSVTIIRKNALRSRSHF